MWFRLDLLVRRTSMTTPPFARFSSLANSYVIVDHERGSSSD
jgi:hypothetical protein